MNSLNIIQKLIGYKLVYEEITVTEGGEAISFKYLNPFENNSYIKHVIKI